MHIIDWYKNSSDPSLRFHKYAVMWLIAWIMGLILTMCLFFRGTPYDGTPYVIDLWHYFPHAIFYMTYGISVISFPFMLSALLSRKEDYKKVQDLVFGAICALLLAFSLLYEHVDNEVLRYCNMHITYDFLTTYVLSQGVPDALWSLLADDAGGSNWSLYLLSVPVVFLILWFVFGRKISINRFVRKPLQWIIFFYIWINVCIPSCFVENGFISF